MMCSFGLKGTADPLLCQDPMSVLPSYASVMDPDVGLDFSENEVMKASQLFGLYLLNTDTKTQLSSLQNEVGGSETEKQTSKDSSEKLVNGKRKELLCGSDALFEGMPFVELKTREVGPCAYCNMWRSVKFLSYCGKFPFCSVSCTKKYAVYKRERGELSEAPTCDTKLEIRLQVPTLFEQHKPKPFFLSHKQLSPLPRSKLPGARFSSPSITHNASGAILPFDWSSYLESEEAEAASIRCFKHAPLNTEWKSTLMGAMLEVQNGDPLDSADTYWVARIIQVAGYRARLRFEGYGIDSDHDFWIHLCTTESYPINGAVRVGKKLKPPKGVLERLGESWQDHISRVAHAGSLTITVPIEKVKQGLSCPFKKGMRLEVVYKKQISHTCIATVTDVVADRIHVQYEDCKDPSKDFWFHYTSSWIHPVGWSQRIGHPIIASAAYKSEALDKGRHQKGGQDDAPWDIFTLPPFLNDHGFQVGMKMEVVDPLKLGNICAATVMEVLEEGYLMVAVDGCLDDKSSWFCQHVTSPMLLPVGFCEYNQIHIIPPRGSEVNFDWDDYLRETQSISAPVELFHQKNLDRGFRVSQKVEAVDLIESGLICVGTIVKIAGPLLSIHFDGWASSFDQWMDYESPDIYPVGWCEMVGYPLQAPKLPEPSTKFGNGNQEKSFKKRSRHSSSSEKKRRLENGGISVSHTSSSSSSLGANVTNNPKEHLSLAKKDTSISTPASPEIHSRVPPLHSYTVVHDSSFSQNRNNSASTVESKQLSESVYSFDNIDNFSVSVPVKKKFKALSASSTTNSTSQKEKKKKLKKNKKEKREKRKEKKKKDKKRSKGKKKKEKRELSGFQVGALKGHEKSSIVLTHKTSETLPKTVSLHTSHSDQWPGKIRQSGIASEYLSNTQKMQNSDSSQSISSREDSCDTTTLSGTGTISHLNLKSISKTDRITKAKQIVFDSEPLLPRPVTSVRNVVVKTERPLPSLTKITKHSDVKSGHIKNNKMKKISEMTLQRPPVTASQLSSHLNINQDVKNLRLIKEEKNDFSLGQNVTKDGSSSSNALKRTSHETSPMFFKKKSSNKTHSKTTKSIPLDKLAVSDPYSLEAEFPTTIKSETPKPAVSPFVKTKGASLKLAEIQVSVSNEQCANRINVIGSAVVPTQQKCVDVGVRVELQEPPKVMNYVDLNILSKGMREMKSNVLKASSQIPVFGGDVHFFDGSRQGGIGLIPVPQYSALDSPISSSSSTGNIQGNLQKMDVKSPIQFSPSSQKVDLSSFPTPSSSNEGGNSTNSSPQKLGEAEEIHHFDDGAVDDLLFIIEKDLRTCRTGEGLRSNEVGGCLSDDAAAKEFITKLSPVKGQTELDADKQVEEILQAIRARSSGQGSSEPRESVVKTQKSRNMGDDKKAPAKKKARARSKSSDKPQTVKKRRKSQLADLLQSPGRLDLSNIDPAFYMEGAFSKDGQISPVSVGRLTQPIHAGPLKAHDPIYDDDTKSNASLLVGMLNGVNALSSQTSPLLKNEDIRSPLPSFRYEQVPGIKRPTNLLFSTENLPNNFFAAGKPHPLVPFQPPVSPSAKSPLLKELVKPPTSSSNGSSSSPVLNMALQRARIIPGMVSGQGSPFRPISPYDAPHMSPRFTLPLNVSQEQSSLTTSPSIPRQRMPWFRPEQLSPGSLPPNAALALRAPVSLPCPMLPTGGVPQTAPPPSSVPSSPVGVNVWRGPSPIRNISPKLPSGHHVLVPSIDQQVRQPFRLPLTFQVSNSTSLPQRLPSMQTLLKRSPITSNPPSPIFSGLQLSPRPIGNSPGPLSPSVMVSPGFSRPPSHLGNPLSPPTQQMISSPVFVSESQPEQKKKKKAAPLTAMEAIPRSPLSDMMMANPWVWSVADVVQFLHDAGEGGCAETFYRQQINGLRLMSLNKEQIVKLTGVKVASSLKIYQQMLKLRSMFPRPDSLTPTASPGSHHQQDGP